MKTDQTAFTTVIGVDIAKAKLDVAFHDETINVKNTEKDLKQLRKRLESPAVIAKADRLAQAIQGFYSDLR